MHGAHLPERTAVRRIARGWHLEVKGCERVAEESGSAAQGVLGVFQKLVASRAHDAEGFRILGALLQHLPLDALQPYLPTVRALGLITRLPAVTCHDVFPVPVRLAHAVRVKALTPG